MARSKRIDDWIASVDGKSTFAGVIVDFFDEMCEDNYWRAESTRKHYIADYERRVLPFIDEHDQRTIDSYTYTEYREIISMIRNTGKYSEERILHFMRLMGAVTRMAEKKYGYPNVLWGTAFELPASLDAKEKVRELITLKRSLSPKQEIELYRKLTSDVRMSGQSFGVYLMFLFGVRNGEAAAITFSDILESYTEDGFHALVIYKTIESKQHRLVSSGKTKNADRIVPIPEEAYRYLMLRKKYVAEQTGKCVNELEDYPVACVGRDFERNSTPDQIAQAAKVIFAEIGLKPKVLTYLDYEILRGEDPVVVREKDPTSYLMRRNFATQMGIIGMNEPEIQFLLGHDITDAYETRNEMVSFESLKRMGKKMRERALFYKSAEDVDLSDVDYNVEVAVKDFSAVNLHLDLAEDETVLLRVKSAEPRSSISVRLASYDGCKLERTEYKTLPEYREDRTINVLSAYHTVYTKNERGV